MKKMLTLSALLFTVALGTSACAPPVANAAADPIPVITLSPEDTGSLPTQPKDLLNFDASLSMRTFFTSIDYESHANGTEKEITDYKQAAKDFPRTLKMIDSRMVSQDDTLRLLREYVANVKTIPNDGYIGMDPKTFTSTADGKMTVKGSNLYIVYKSGADYVTHKGPSMTSTESMNDVFTLSEVDGKWKITGIQF